MVEGEGVEKMMGEGDGEEKDTALLLNSIVKGGRGLGCSTAAAATALPVTAVAGALITATGTVVHASMELKVVLVEAQGVPIAASSADSAAVWVATARSTAALECLAHLAVEG